MTGFSLWYVNFVYDVIQTVRSSMHLSTQVRIAICKTYTPNPRYIRKLRLLPWYTQSTEYDRCEKDEHRPR